MKKLILAITLIAISMFFQGCPHPVQPCVPQVIKEPFEVKVPIPCQHPVCEEPILLPTSASAGSYFTRAKNHKANDKMKEKHNLCLQSSIQKCEGNTSIATSSNLPK